MKGTERRIADMLRQVATRDVVVLDDLGGSPRHLAALAYVAVQYGFRYEGTSRLGRTLQVRLVRDLRPEARERSTAALGRLAAGRAPGMRPGTLKPLPDVAPAVDLLKARIEFDALDDDLDWRRQAVFMSASAALMALLLIPVGWRASLAAGATMAAVFALLLRLEVRRKDRLARRLRPTGPTVRGGSRRRAGPRSRPWSGFVSAFLSGSRTSAPRRSMAQQSTARGSAARRSTARRSTAWRASARRASARRPLPKRRH